MSGSDATSEAEKNVLVVGAFGSLRSSLILTQCHFLSWMRRSSACLSVCLSSSSSSSECWVRLSGFWVGSPSERTNEKALAAVSEALGQKMPPTTCMYAAKQNGPCIAHVLIWHSR